MARKKGWSKSARGKGYRVENDFVKMMQSWGWFAMRLPSWLQKGIMRAIDGIFYDPFKKIFGFFQAKYNKKYLHKEEKERIQEVCRKYNTIAYFVWRKDEYTTRGLKFEILN